MSFRNIRLGAILLMCCLWPITASTTPTDLDRRIAEAAASQVLTNRAIVRDGIYFEPDAAQTLGFTGVSSDRFRVSEVAVLDARPDGDSQVLTVGIVFEETTGRRLWMVTRLWYDRVGPAISVGAAEAYWNSPQIPQVQVRAVPRGTIAASRPVADSFAASVALLDIVTGAALPPDSADADDADFVVIFVDRVARDAEVRVTLADSVEGEAVRELSAHRLEATGWPILLVPGDELSGGYLQVRYTPGSDGDPADTDARLIGAIELP